MAAPSLTVLLPCYNVAPFRPACLHSLLAQPGADQLKVIVVDDGPTDGSLQARAVALHPGMREKMLMHVAREIGRAPRFLRVALATRSWRQVRSGSPLRRARCLQLLNASMRTEAKALMRRGARPRTNTVSLLRAGQRFGAVRRAACWNVRDARGWR